MQTILLVIAVIVIGYLFLSGLSRILRRKMRPWRWSYQRPNIAVRERAEITGFRAVLSGVFRLVLAAVLIYFVLQIAK